MATNADTESEEKRNEGLQCYLCSGTFRKPKTLDCSHSFCEDCLQSHIRKFQEEDALDDGVKCPNDTCSKRTPMDLTDGSSESWIEALPTNLSLMSLIEAAQGQEDADDEIPMCLNCRQRGIKTPASSFCINCNEPQCPQCSEIHRHFTFAKGHTVVSLEQIKQCPKQVTENILRCKHHSKKLKYYCKDHRKMCCSQGVIEDHRKCGEVKKIADVANDSETGPKFRQVNGKMVALRQKAQEACALLVSNENKLKSQFEAVPMEVMAAERRIIERFAVLKQKLSSGEILNDTINENNEEKQRIMQLQHKIRKTLHMYESCVANGSTVQKFVSVEKLNQHYEELLRETDDCFNDVKCLSVSLELTDEVKQVLAAMSLGKICISRKSTNIESLMTRKLKLKHSIVLPLGWKRLLSGLTFISDGRLIAVDFLKYDCILFDSELNILAIHSLRYCPLGVTVIKDNEVIITGTNKSVTRYKVTHSNQIEELGSVTVSSEYYSLSRVKEGSYIAGIYDTKRPACLTSDDGVEIQLDINFKHKIYERRDTRCCYSSATDSVILTERHTNTVFIYGMTDKSELEITDQSIVEPRGVTVSNDGCIFVCSFGNNSIVQISPWGSVISSTRCEGMNGPHSICLNTDGSLIAVSNCTNAYYNSDILLQVYNIEGK